MRFAQQSAFLPITRQSRRRFLDQRHRGRSENKSPCEDNHLNRCRMASSQRRPASDWRCCPSTRHKNLALVLRIYDPHVFTRVIYAIWGERSQSYGANANTKGVIREPTQARSYWGNGMSAAKQGRIPGQSGHSGYHPSRWQFIEGWYQTIGAAMYAAEAHLAWRPDAPAEADAQWIELSTQSPFREESIRFYRNDCRDASA